jgi:ElaB/YqjD/DUF883 family membrane-anchored ribosome-binding protein
MKKVSAIALCALTLLALSSCSKPPEMEMTAASTSIESAKGAEAEQYAPSAFNTARDTLNAAMAAKTEQDAKFALFRSYKESQRLFVKADELAKKAAANAAAEKERVKQEVTAKLAEVQQFITDTEMALKKAPVGKGNKAEIELMKNDFAAAQGAFGEAQNDFNAGKYLGARAKVDVVKTRVQAIADELTKAAEARKGKKR